MSATVPPQHADRSQPLLRPVGRADAEAWHGLRLRMLREHPAAFGASAEEHEARGVAGTTERFESMVQQPDDRLLGAWWKGQLVGAAGLHRPTAPKRRHRALIWGMYVAPEARGKGIGRALLHGVLDHARRLDGVTHVQLSVIHGNRAARRLYERAGFHVWGREPAALHVAGRDHDELHMSLPLADAARGAPARPAD